MQSYRVTWEIDIEANSAADAATQALAIQRRPNSIATVFETRDETGRLVRVDLTPDEDSLPGYYECGICDCLHPLAFNGDCRDDSNRFAPDELDAKHGSLGWNAVPMPE